MLASLERQYDDAHPRLIHNLHAASVSETATHTPTHTHLRKCVPWCNSVRRKSSSPGRTRDCCNASIVAPHRLAPARASCNNFQVLQQNGLILVSLTGELPTQTTLTKTSSPASESSLILLEYHRWSLWDFDFISPTLHLKFVFIVYSSTQLF